MPVGNHHQKVKAAPRLHEDIHALTMLFCPSEPPRRAIRPSKTSEALYMFGDASGAGFGSSLKIRKDIMRAIEYVTRYCYATRSAPFNTMHGACCDYGINWHISNFVHLNS